MKLSTPELLLDARAVLGEGPAWDSAHQRLYWVDILAGHLHIYQPENGQDQSIPVGQAIGCAAPARDGRVALGLKEGFALFDPASSELTFLARPEDALPGNRFNDGKCAPDGRFLAGSMDNAEVEASGSLYSLGVDGVLKTLLSGVRISNGLAWSPDYKTLYFIDTPTRQVLAYDYDLQSGDIANPRLAVSIPEALGWPDGMTSDVEGMLWVALWGGAKLTRWNPATGQLMAEIPIPAFNVSSCAFGGPDLTDIYITSARKGMTADQLAKYPLSGGLFRLHTNIQGMPTFEFGA